MAGDPGRPGPRRRETRSAPIAEDGRGRASPLREEIRCHPIVGGSESLTPASRRTGELPGACWDRSRQSLTGGGRVTQDAAVEPTFAIGRVLGTSATVLFRNFVSFG